LIHSLLGAFLLLTWNPDSLREHMVETQIEARGIQDENVLDAMRVVRRHCFVPSPYTGLAYEDTPLPIGEGQTISQPYIVALMTELLELCGDERVLEIGTGSGYGAAVLAEIAAEVYTIEILPSLAERADSVLEVLGYDDVHVRAGDGYQGWPGAAPFDGIVVTCAPPYVPEPLIEQLAQGGRMVVPVGTNYQELRLIRKEEGKLSERSVIPVRFVPMTGPGVEGARPEEDE
jgi:protein-L-isoaspartate(D-aspartate) O-methyltransferase